MEFTEIAKRAVATAIQSAFAVVVAAGLDLIQASVVEQAAVAALAGAATVIHRAAQRWLAENPEG